MFFVFGPLWFVCLVWFFYFLFYSEQPTKKSYQQRFFVYPNWDYAWGYCRNCEKYTYQVIKNTNVLEGRALVGQCCNCNMPNFHYYEANNKGD